MGYSEKGKQGFQRTHCLSKHPLYNTWIGIKVRCYNKNSVDYKDYGNRGIVMCDKWKNDFKKFYDWAISNGWEKGLTIERKDFNGNYEPNNCEWIPMYQQSKNRRSCKKVTYKGETHTISEWSRIKNISRKTLERRLKSKNFTLDEAFENPINKNLARR